MFERRSAQRLCSSSVWSGGKKKLFSHWMRYDAEVTRHSAIKRKRRQNRYFLRPSCVPLWKVEIACKEKVHNPVWLKWSVILYIAGCLGFSSSSSCLESKCPLCNAWQPGLIRWATCHPWIKWKKMRTAIYRARGDMNNWNTFDTM